MPPKLIFDIVFGLLLFIALLVSYLWIAGCLPVAPPADIVNWIRAVSLEMLRSLRLARLPAGAAAPIGNGATNGAPTMRGGSIENPIPTASHQVPCNKHSQEDS